MRNKHKPLGFVENCGISVSARTPYYAGGWGLYLHLAHTEEGMAMGLSGKQYYDVRHLFCEEYIPEQHDRYDIYPLEGKEYIEIILEDMDFLLMPLCLHCIKRCWMTCATEM